MSAKKDIRWRQRFQNYEQSFQLLERTIGIVNPSEAERGGLIQFFEVTFELAWKLMKDYLEAEGYQIQSPRGALKQGFQSGVLIDGHAWMEALDDRNRTTHTYDEVKSKLVAQAIREKYFPLLRALYQTMRAKLP